MSLPAEDQEARWEAAARLLERAQADLAAGRLAEAEAKAARAAGELAATAGADHPDHAHAIQIQGAILAARGELAAALRRFDQALAIFARYPDEPLVRAMDRRACAEVADLLIKLGRFAEAEALLQTLLEENAAEDEDTAFEIEIRNLLGVCLRLDGRHGEAESAYTRALDLAEKTGRRVPATLLHNLAGLASARGDHATAEHRARAALARRREDGQSGFAIAVELCGLGDALAGQARFDEAESAYREALDLYARSEQPDHPEVAYALHNLADTLVEQGRAAEAERAYRQSLARKERCFGGDHLEVAASLNNLAALLFENGRGEEARALGRRAVAIARRTLAPEHPVRAGCESLAREIGAT
jgi:tetratricopeptide (TPR) repeat protein